jgi:hypothetical protein
MPQVLRLVSYSNTRFSNRTFLLDRKCSYSYFRTMRIFLGKWIYSFQWPIKRKFRQCENYGPFGVRCQNAHNHKGITHIGWDDGERVEWA